MYCAENNAELPYIETAIDEDNLDYLWHPPNRNSFELDEAAIYNLNGFGKESAETQESAPDGQQQMRYDVPRPLIEAKTTEQKLRYENEVLNFISSPSEMPSQIPPPYINDVVTYKETNNNIGDNGYEVPNPNPTKYMNMNKQKLEWFANYKNVGENNKHNITNNLDVNIVDKNVSKTVTFKSQDS